MITSISRAEQESDGLRPGCQPRHYLQVAYRRTEFEFLNVGVGSIKRILGFELLC